MSAKWPLPFMLAFGLTAARATGPTIAIYTASPSGKVYGIAGAEKAAATIIYNFAGRNPQPAAAPAKTN